MRRFRVVVLGVSGLLVGCAGTRAVGSGTVMAARGSIVTNGQITRAIVVGPTVIHAYSEDNGGDLYSVPAVTGSSGDCAGTLPNHIRRTVAIAANRRVILNVESGQIACLATTNARTFELLWHAQPEGHADTADVRFAIASAPRR